jgi:hypothetical protein
LRAGIKSRLSTNVLLGPNKPEADRKRFGSKTEAFRKHNPAQFSKKTMFFRLESFRTRKKIARRSLNECDTTATRFIFEWS